MGKVYGHQEGNIWVVAKGDCLWNIAEKVYGNGRKWTQIADANGIKRSSGLIYVGNRLKLPGISSSSTTKPVVTSDTNVKFEWFALDCDEQRAMFAVWSFSRSNTDHYEVNWDYDTGQGGWRTGSHGSTSGNTDGDKQSAYAAPYNAKKVRLQVKPIAKKNNKNKYYWTNGAWETKEYDYSNNPPELPPSPSFGINSQDELEVQVTNIQQTINADKIEIAIYQDDTTKYSTGMATINEDARYAYYKVKVPTGHKYKVRIRAVRGEDIYGGWTDFTENDMSHPDAPEKITTLRPEIISEQMAKTYGVFAEWPEVNTARQYEIQWTTNIIYFDTGSNVESRTTEEGQGPKILITDLELGHEYFFRVRSINNKGNSLNWSAIRSVTLGVKPSAPTTYSNTSSTIIDEDLNLYWIHNSADGSLEKYARLHMYIIDSMHPSQEPLEVIKVIENTKPEEEKNQTSVYTINASDPEWSNLQSGFIIKWKVQTCGITSEYSDWSIEREVNIYARPTVSIDIQNQNGDPLVEVNSFPFFINILSGPSAQVPISYYIEVIANEGYETVDNVGNVKTVNPGDKIYQKYYDPQVTNKWNFIIEMTPGNIDLENSINYTINCNSGLSATSSLDFLAYFDDVFYDVFADIIINKETLEASIHPYCYEYNEINGETVPSLVDGCKLSVYRREYDGSFTEISTNIDNIPNMFITDPHPSLDYARYRVTARTDSTGAISYADIPGEKVGEPSVVIQWSEKWSRFDVAEDGVGVVEPAWSGSMIKIPYNIDVNENKSVDVSLINYVGREHPVSYYGTHIGETASWNVEIPADDKELLYALRRLSKWTGDVYVREPSGTGYWANISVSLDIQHMAVTIPVTFNIVRVEGGI